MSQMQFLKQEEIQVVDEQAWVETEHEKIEAFLMVTNFRFLIFEKKGEKKGGLICSLDLNEIEKVEAFHNETLCYLKGDCLIQFESIPIGKYLKQLKQS